LTLFGPSETPRKKNAGFFARGGVQKRAFFEGLKKVTFLTVFYIFEPKTAIFGVWAMPNPSPNGYLVLGLIIFFLDFLGVPNPTPMRL
jgi:hypothetical protein